MAYYSSVWDPWIHGTTGPGWPREGRGAQKGPREGRGEGHRGRLAPCIGVEALAL